MADQYRRIELRWKKDDMLATLVEEAQRRGMSLQQFIYYVMRTYYLAKQGDLSLLDELVPRSLPVSAPLDSQPTAPKPEAVENADHAVDAWLGLMSTDTDIEELS